MQLLTNPKPHAYVFVDGSASKRNDIGGWAAFVTTTHRRKLLVGMCCPTTISRMELTPIVESLRWIRHELSRDKGFRVCVYSDSEYTVKTLCGLYPRSKNEDLWAGLDVVVQGMNITYRWRERNTLMQTELVDAVCGMVRGVNKKALNEYFTNYLEPEKAIPHFPFPDDIEDEKEINECITPS